MIDAATQLERHWLIASTSRQLRQQPYGCSVLDTPIVLFRAGEQIAVMLDRCPHRNAPLAAGKIVDSAIQCPYHGWRFDATGKCIRRPGVAEPAEFDCHIKSFHARERNGFVWVNLSERLDIPHPPETQWWRDSRFSRFTWTSHIEAEFVDAMENLLDATHTPFVHSGVLRSEQAPRQFRASVRIKNGVAEAEYTNEGKQSGWVSRIFERDRASSFGRFIPPCIAELEYTSSRGTEFVLNSHFTPVSAQAVRLYSTFFVRKTRVPMFIKRGLLTPFFRRVLKQDQAILRLQQDNIRRFGSAHYRSWEGDLLRGLIETWLRTGEFPKVQPERIFELNL